MRHAVEVVCSMSRTLKRSNAAATLEGVVKDQNLAINCSARISNGKSCI